MYFSTLRLSPVSRTLVVFWLSAVFWPAHARAQDCNQNGIPDPIDVASGTSGDCDSNGVPDECQFGTTLVFEDFDGGASLPPGVAETLGGLWHVTAACRPPGGGASGSHAYFGQDGPCNFETGGSPAGDLTLSSVPLPPDAVITLSYWSYYQGEGGGQVNCDPTANFDSAVVWVAGTLVDNHCDDPSASEWRFRTVDLSPWAGQTVDVVWDFNAYDEFANNAHGWSVDDVRIVTMLDASGNGVPDLCERISVTYCSSNPNSTGATAGLAVFGSGSVADNDVFLRTVLCPPDVFGYYLMSRTPASTPLPAPSQGILCLGSPIVRFAQDVLFSGGAGEMRMRLDLSNLPQGTVFQPGETWRFQCWFRDGPSSNTSRGVSVDFL